MTGGAEDTEPNPGDARPDDEDRLRHAYVLSAQRLLAPLRAIELGGDWHTRASAALAQLLGAIADERDAARLLIVQGRSGGPALRHERELTLECVEEAVEDALQQALAAGAPTLDAPARALIGGVRGVVARHLRNRSERVLPSLCGDLLAWVESYTVAPAAGRWSTGPRSRLPSPPPREPQPPPRARYRLPPGTAVRSRRARLMYATAETMQRKGYAAVTIADIAAAAGVSCEVFYEHFRDKQHAFQEAQGFLTQRILDTCAAAYFGVEGWPRRVWAGMETLLGIVAEHPELAHLRLVESYAAGPAATGRAEEITRAFSIFLEEGYHEPSRRATATPRLFARAVSGAVLELVQADVARNRTEHLPERLPQLTYIVLAPFLGAAPARVAVLELAESEPSDV